MMSEFKNEIPHNWIWTTIGQVSRIRKEHIEPKEFPEKEFNYLSIENIEQNTGNLINFKSSKGKEIGSSKLIFTNTDILYSKLRPYLNKVFIPFFSGISATDLIPIVTEQGIKREYVAYYLRKQKVVEYLSSKVHGIQLPRVSVDDICNTWIPVAPEKEQIRIITTINELFVQIKVAKESIDKVGPIMKHFRQSLLETAFRGKLTESDANDESAEKLLEKIRSERKKKWEENFEAKKSTRYEEPRHFLKGNKQNFQDRWPYVSLESVCYKVENGHTPLRSNLTNFDPNGIPLIKVENIMKNGRIMLSEDQLRISKNVHEKQSKSIVFPNDILMNIVGPPLGKIGLVAPEIKEANINQAIVLMRTVNSYDPKILLYCLMSPSYYDLMVNMSRGVRQSNIRKSDVGRIPIPLIPVGEQRRIISKIDELFSFADQIEKSVSEAKKRVETLDQVILTRAFNGDLVRQDPTEEPASILLERIKSERTTKISGSRIE